MGPLDHLRQDIRGSFRLWRQRPLVAAAVLLTMALGTGMNVALFRVVWSALLKPLPYPKAARLVQVWRVTQTAGGFTPRDRRLLWRARSHSFDGLASYRPWRVTVGSGGDPDRAPAGLGRCRHTRLRILAHPIWRRSQPGGTYHPH